MTEHTLDVTLRQDGILLVTIRGDISDEQIPALKEDTSRGSAFIRQESDKALRPLPILVDVTKLNRAYSPEGILVLAEFEKKNRPYVSKTSVYGADIKIKFTGEIISALSDRKNIAFFETEAEAVASLRSDDVAQA